MKSFSEISPGAQARRLHQVAQTALEHYELDVTKLSLYAHRFNAIFGVDTADGARYVLRIGVPGYRDLRDIRSEMLWMAALRRETDIVVPEPVRTHSGELVVTVETQGVPEPRHCVLLRWIPGRHNRYPARRTVAQLGATMARLHNHADTFTPPPDFSTRRMDKIWAFGTPQAVYSEEAHPLFSPERRAIFRESAEQVQAALDALYAEPAGMRFLHADLHLRNVKLYRGAMYVLDFDDSCWCHPVQDIGISLYYLQYLLSKSNFAALREAFREGYSSMRMWPEQTGREVDAIIAARQLDFISFFLQKPGAEAKPFLGSFLERAEQHLRAWLAS